MGAPSSSIGIAALAEPASPGTAALGRATYRMLTGTDQAEAEIADDASFDAHVFASILAVAAGESLAIGEQVGLATAELDGLIARVFPRVPYAAGMWSRSEAGLDCEEAAMVRDLLLANRTTEDDETSRLLAAMIARRAMEPNHLWEDLGLRDRSELSRLLTRHFAPIASRNTQNMRWKRFFYRMLCEAEGFSMCATPVCSNCGDFDLCFGEESGEARLASERRQADLQANAA